MPNLSDERAALKAKAGAILDSAKAMERELTDEETAKVESIFEDIKGLDERIEKATKSSDLFKKFEGLADGEKAPEPKANDDKPANSLGEHFVKHAGARLKEVAGVRGASVAAPEYKAAADTQVTGGHDGAYEHWLTDVDTNFVRDKRRRLVVANLLGSGTITGQAIQYFLEGSFEGGAPNAFDYVAEGAPKPQFHYTDPTPVTEYLRKIAGFVKFTDEMLEDLAFVVSEINNRGLYELALMEENELLNGDGTGGALVGIRNRGIQSESAADADDNADAIFRSMTKVGLATPYSADALVINPNDYQELRLMRDGNGQYYGGGFFQGQYASGSILENPPVWGLRTVVTPAVEVGTALVGNFAQGGTVYRKGGVRVESTNSHADDFTTNLVTTRIEERIALAVRRPEAFVEVTLASGS